ncbi:Type-2 restriction enzyme NspV [Hyella patelloides LEGE 07179]|uniref:Type-2 restriction enzyme NspV n=1 Tax=Hyella patelloides LEGE 07179 TaxID=945734 RepID=A0A563VJG3_9CYAN|nr:restriction endonuclease [Hyella patelloides]VEP11457.1 Type-2 restriction enzyme NspV [Hyella patelloides LEGE 07179]
MNPELTIGTLIQEAAIFAEEENQHNEPSLYGITDGKAVGTYLEKKFKDYLQRLYQYEIGNAASGIDFPSLDVDMKVTSIKQPQSSCPFKSARQKIYGLGYSLLIFVYQKQDNSENKTSRLLIQNTIFVNKERTADYQMTRGILEILARDGNQDDLMAFMYDRNLPVDEIEASNIAEAILSNPPQQGYLTISNALQWRLQYRRVIQQAGEVDGIYKIR